MRLIGDVGLTQFLDDAVLGLAFLDALREGVPVVLRLLLLNGCRWLNVLLELVGELAVDKLQMLQIQL